MIDEVIIVSNHKFYNIFIEWSNMAMEKIPGLKLTILDDGSTENDNRLGAVRDIAFAISECDLNGAGKDK